MNELIARVAYINAQTASMLAELEGMKAANVGHARANVSPKYNEEDFKRLPYTYGVDHNSVIRYLEGT